MSIIDNIKHAWNAFIGRDPTPIYDIGAGYGMRPDRMILSRGSDRSIAVSVYNRIALDVSSIAVKHVQLDKNGRFLEERISGLNNCLTLEANIDQTSRAFLHDAVMSMLDEGVVALVPIDTNIDPAPSGAFDILSIRTAKILEWYPEHVKVRVYNDRTGKFEELLVSKKTTAIIENPLYSVMNAPNSTMQRLLKKLAILDAVDEQKGSNRLDVVIQLPYSIRSDARREQAELRRKDLEKQLSSSKYGVAYVDSTEHVTQLNRPLDNQLLEQVEYLTNLFFSQLGFTTSILNGTADENTMNNYYNRSIEPILSSIVDEMKRKFLTKTARTQGQSILFFRDPFKLMPISNVAEVADKFTRNEIMTANEIRQIVGMKPSQDPNADALKNSNISKAADEKVVDVDGNEISGNTNKEEIQNA